MLKEYDGAISVIRDGSNLFTKNLRYSPFQTFSRIPDIYMYIPRHKLLVKGDGALKALLTLFLIVDK